MPGHPGPEPALCRPAGGKIGSPGASVDVEGGGARRIVPGAAWMVAGIAVNLAAAGVQQSDLSIRLGSISLDHNGIFHLVQMAAVVALAVGVRRGLGAFARTSPDRQL